MGGRHPPDRAHPRVRQPRLPRRPLGPPGPGRARPAGGHAGRRLRGRRRQAGQHCRSRIRVPRDMAALQAEARQGRAPADDRRRARLEHRRPEGAWKPSPSASTCRSRRPSAIRTTSTTGIAATSAAPASASIPSSPPPSRTADLLIVIGARLGEMTTSGYTLLDIPEPNAVPRARPSLARRAGLGLPPRSADRRDARRPSPRRWARLQPPAKIAWSRHARRAARRLRALASSPSRCRAP